jgi:hypothetical protein
MVGKVLPKIIGSLLAIVGILGVVLLVFDQVLSEVAPLHYYALTVFVLVDFVLAGLVVVHPSKSTLTLAVAWSLLRIIIQVGDIVLGSTFGTNAYFNAGQFGIYLFNPLYTTSDNPPGIPGGVLDLILILQLAVVGLGWKARRATTSTG